jgi:hypothetical protein
MERDRRSASEAARQDGILHRETAFASGHTSGSLHRRVDAGRLERVQPQVYLVAGAPVTWNRELRAACLSAKAYTSPRAAAAIWGIYHERTAPTEIVVVRGRLPRPSGVIVHRSTDLRECDVTVRFDLPVTNPLRTLVDLGAVVPEWAVDHALSEALAKRLVTLAGVTATLEALGRRGRRGAGVLRRLLEARGGLAPDSVLEGYMHRICRRYGLPVPRFHYVVRKGQRVLAEVDFAYPQLTRVRRGPAV